MLNIRYYLRLLFVQLQSRSDFTNFLFHGFYSPRCCQRLYVNINKINHALNCSFPLRAHSGLILSGDWDLDLVPLEKNKRIKSVMLHVNDGLTWEETGIKELIFNEVLKFGVSDGCKNREDIELRYKKLDELISYLKNGHRYLTRNYFGDYRERGGVLIHVGRRGELIFGNGGCHRLAIVKAINYQIIPVQLGAVHFEAIKNGYFKDIMLESAKLLKLSR